MAHVMISYQWDDQKFCIKMKDYLIEKGYDVWMDVDEMHGSILEAMASAVEASYCVIICMSEKYKESKNCKLEAEYVVNSNKKFVPLLMEDGYRPDGW